ncbi:MAG TPA: hypothetical protein VFP37_05985 [Steroidobacteraceae bacterium]|nr:hypothetical protein [Steroidobacteraceae bacterium]
MPTQSFRRILETLEQHGVEYVVVGGVAAVLQGAPVTTFDLDALIRIDPQNVDRIAGALAAIDARYREHAGLRPSREDLAAGGHLLLMTDSGPFDVLGFIGDGKRYDDILSSTVTIDAGGLTIKVLSLAALVEEKKALGRDKDLAVVKLLEAVLARQNQKR